MSSEGEKSRENWNQKQFFLTCGQDEIGLDMPGTFTYHTQPQAMV